MPKIQQDLAIAALADIWFGNLKISTKTGDTPHRSTSETDSDLRDAARMIVATLKRFGDSPGPIAEVIEQVGDGLFYIRSLSSALTDGCLRRSPETRRC
jgi:hypothetical protein